MEPMFVGHDLFAKCSILVRIRSESDHDTAIMMYEHTLPIFFITQNHIYTSTTIILPFYASQNSSSLQKIVCSGAHHVIIKKRYRSGISGAGGLFWGGLGVWAALRWSMSLT